MIHELLEAWNDPRMRHAMIIHFPVVLSLIGLPFAVLAALWHRGERGRIMLWTALAIYAAMTASALAARYSGSDAEEAVEGSLSEAGHHELEEHREDGINLWLWPAGATALLAVGFVPRKPVRIAAGWLAVAAGAVTAAAVAETADHGGHLVYEHGAGAPVDLAWLLRMPAEAAPAGDPRIEFFREQVKPILVNHCLRCHNPGRLKRAGGLDQTTIEGMLVGGMSGPAIVPGKPQESLLITAVRWDDPDLEMPKGKEKLAEEQIAVLEKWIADGAVWEGFEWKGLRD